MAQGPSICSLYWIHLPEHTDITSEGYVGITKGDLNKRFRQHKCKANNGSKYIVHSAIRKHGDRLVYELVLVGDVDYCKLIEKKLRPTPNLAWNINVGGESPPMTGRVHSESTREKIRAATLNMAPELREAANKHLVLVTKGTPPWHVPGSNKDVWLIAEEIYKYCANNPKHGYVKVSRHFKLNTAYSSSVICKKIKTENWIPTEDQDWLLWSSKLNLNYKEVVF